MAAVIGMACATALVGCSAVNPTVSNITHLSDPVHPAGAAAASDVTQGVTPTVERDAAVQFYPSDQPLRLGVEHFNRGDYGIAEHYFRDAVQKAPKDVSAWTGLAASYDHLGRFDLSDGAYREAIHLVGETPTLLNNLGYSYMLRGDYKRARKYLLKAYARDPNNPVIANNLRLLDGSQHYVERSGEAH